ncbi:unnamed protein product [Haemonchus placei]|uniref:WYL domain-containing protein n=1 Tax=Haemonchus placei TaxID=6290 RepID=A0A0N4VXN8_HAEPC|nr:unnamed protein product [Haemonchus placei]
MVELGVLSPIILSPDEHGCPVKDKLTDLRKRIAQKKCDSIILSALDDIMCEWRLRLLNIRGFDIKYNPLAYSYVLVTPSEVHLFMDKADDVVRNSYLTVLQLGFPFGKLFYSAVRKYLESEGVTLHPYADAYDFMTKWYEQQAGLNKHKPRVFVPRNTNYLFGQIFETSAVVDGSPVQVMKGVKNPVELEGMRNSHIRDSAALVSFLMWLEMEILEGRLYSEIEVASKIESMRAALDKYVGLR